MIRGPRTREPSPQARTARSAAADRRRRRGHRWAGASGTALLVAAVSLGCSTSLDKAPQDLGAAAPAPTAGVTTRPSSGQPATPDLTIGYTGQPVQVSVPTNATGAYLTVRGGAGWAHSNVDARGPGRGVILTGTLDVVPGDTLSVAAGGKGAQEKTNKHPGAGGWSIPPYAGGRGGSGHGSQTYDGAGGGGASVVQRNSTVVVVAGGGGGEGGPAYHDGLGPLGTLGGAGGVASGSDGGASSGSAGRGGSAKRPSLNPTGGSYSGHGIKGGGGGGGGGRFPGGGGDASFGGVTAGGGGGGGGGSSLSDALVRPTFATGTTGSAGDGSVDITWLYSPPSATAWTFTKINAPTPQVIEGRPATNQTPPATVITHSLTYQQDGVISPQQVWTYTVEKGETAGQLVNQQTGLCLEVNGNSGAIDQWTCQSASANHRWRLTTRHDGVVDLRIDLPDGDTPRAAGAYYLATPGASDSTVDGTSLTLLDDGQSDRTAWSASPRR